MTQLTIPGIPKPSRPDVTEEMIKVAVEKVALSVSCDEKYILRAYSYPMDGFELAKELIQDHIDVDRDDIDEFDCIDDLVREQLKAAIKVWVDEHDIQPPHALGALVSIRSRHYPGQYEITGIRTDEAQYELKPVGQNDEECGSRRHIVNYEGVSVADAEVTSES